ncbi:MAG: phosphate butyryltransferase [Acholeplasmataceae bacterium]|jgi:phosphate butyryltransferase|nr:phosphate butyryltransferase [Acholeplasmataceae bacterium]
MRDFNQLISKSKNLKRKRIVVASANDLSTLKALEKASEIIPLEITLIDNQKELKATIETARINLTDYQIIDLAAKTEIAEKAVYLIKTNKADILMKGLIETNTLLKAVVNKEKGIRKEKLLSHISLFSFPRSQKIIYASDCAMNIEPTVDQKIAIIDNLLLLVKKLGVINPKVALISAVEKPNPKIVSSTDAILIKEHYDAINNKDFLVDGPFAIDNVVSKEAALKKSITSEIKGDADALIFPNIDSGNVFYKTAIYLSRATAAGIVLGAQAPIVLTSRADSVINKFYSILLAGVYCDEN